MKTENNEHSNIQFLPNIEERIKRTKANQQRDATENFTLDPETYQALTRIIQELVDQLSIIIRENPAFNDSQQDAVSDHNASTAGSDNGLTNSSGGVNIGGVNIPDSKIVNINEQEYSVGFLKTQLDTFAASFKPEIVDAAFGIFPWGTSSSLAAGNAFQTFISTHFPKGEPK